MRIGNKILTELKNLKADADRVSKRATTLIVELEGREAKKMASLPKRYSTKEILEKATNHHNKLRRAV